MSAVNVQKILLFGLLGALGCLGGWLVGEGFLRLALPTGKDAGVSLASKPVLPALDGPASLPAPPPPALAVAPTAPTTAPAPPAPPPLAVAAGASAVAPPRAEFAQRLEKAGAKSGDVQISLIWFNVNDLDLHCIDPSGEEIFWDHRRSRSGGELDVDMNDSGRPETTERPVENIYWPKGGAPLGKYAIYVNHYANRGGRDPSSYKVSVLADGRRQEFTGEISNGQPKKLIAEFEVGTDLRLAVSPEMTVHQGGSNELKVRLARRNVVGPVTVRLEGDVRGITPHEFVLAADQTDAAVHVTAESTAPLGTRVLSLKASSGRLKAEASFRLSIQKMPSELHLAVSPELVVNQGGMNRLQVRLARNFQGPVRLRVEGDVRGLTAHDVTLAATDTDAQVDLGAAAATAPGARKMKVVARADGVQAQAPFRLLIQAVPPSLRLAVPAELQINDGGHNELPLRIARHGFTGPVDVRLEGETTGVAPTRFTIPADRDGYEVALAAENAALGTRALRVLASGGGVHADGKLNLTVLRSAGRAAGHGWWWLVLIIGLWTALLAAGLSFALVIGQNWYMARRWLSWREGLILLAGSLVAGVIAGGGGQALYGLLTQAGLVPGLGFLAGWLLLGGLLGRGVGLFIPNLSPWRAAVAGSGGGLLGAGAFIAVSAVGDVAGRLTGAALLGFAIGLMVALVETVYRKVWLEVAFGPRTVRAVNLGQTPVFIGGDAGKCTIVVPGAPAKALKFWETNGQVYCLDLLAEKTMAVAPGYRQRLRDAQIVVCSSVRPSPVVAPAPVSAPPAARLPTPPATAPKEPRCATAPPAAATDAKQAPATASCPLCGQSATGVPGKRRCPNCFNMF